MIPNVPRNIQKFSCLILFVALVSNSVYAESFVVNTDIEYQDNLLKLDADNTVGIDTVTLQFGTTAANYLKYNPTAGYFSFGTNLNMGGNEIQDFSLEKHTGTVLDPIPTCDSTTKGHLYFKDALGDFNTYACDGTNWEDVTALATTSSKVVTVGGAGADYSDIASAATYLNTLSGGIMLLSAQTHNITTAVNLKNITLVGKDDSDTIISIFNSGEIDSYDTAFKFLTINVADRTSNMAIDVASGANSLYFEWVSFNIAHSSDSLIDSSAAPTVVMKFVKCDESGGLGKILKLKSLSNLNDASPIFIDSRSTDNALQISDWDAKVTTGGNVNTTGTLYPIPADTIIVSPAMNVQAAIDSLETTARGGSITLLPGTYTISQPLTIEDDGIQISGYGDSTVINATGFSGPTQTTAAIQVGAANGTVPRDNVVISDLKVEVSSEIHGIRVAGGQDNRIQNVTVKKMSGLSLSGKPDARIGIQMLDGTAEKLVRPQLLNSRVFGTDSVPAYFTDGMHVSSDNSYNGVWGYGTDTGDGIVNALVDGNNVDYVKETSYAIVGAKSSALFNNRATRMGAGGGGFGIFIGNSSNINMNANVFSGSLANGAIGIGIDALPNASAKQTADCIFDNNVIDGFSNITGAQGFAIGFQIGDSDTDISVYRNSFQSNSILGASNTTTIAVEVNGNSDDNTISQSNISGGTNPWDTGVDIQSSSAERNKVVVNRYNNVTNVLIDAGTSTQLGVTHHRASGDPAATDDIGDGYQVGTIWINTTSNTSFILVNNTLNNAVWNRVVQDNTNITGTNSNTFTLDQDNTGGNVTLQFGQALNKTLQWDGTRFNLSDDLNIADNLSVGAGATSAATRLDVNGDLALRYTGYGASNGNNNNINIGAFSFIRITGPTAAFAITGITGGVNGKFVVLYNTTTQNMSITNDSASSLAANRIYNNGFAATTGAGAVLLFYDSNASRWIVVANQP